MKYFTPLLVTILVYCVLTSPFIAYILTGNGIKYNSFGVLLCSVVSVISGLLNAHLNKNK